MFRDAAGETESMVRKGGLYVNFERVESTDELFDKEKHVLTGGTTIIRIGESAMSFQDPTVAISVLISSLQERSNIN